MPAVHVKMIEEYIMILCEQERWRFENKNRLDLWITETLEREKCNKSEMWITWLGGVESAAVFGALSGCRNMNRVVAFVVAFARLHSENIREAVCHSVD